MSNKKQSSVEFLIQCVMEAYDIENPQLINAMIVAIAKHRAEIIEANISGMKFIPADPNHYNENAEQYYNQIFQ